MKRHRKARPAPGGQQIPAQIIEFEAPLHHLECDAGLQGNCDQRTRVGYRQNEDGYKVALQQENAACDIRA